MIYRILMQKKRLLPGEFTSKYKCRRRVTYLNQRCGVTMKTRGGRPKKMPLRRYWLVEVEEVTLAEPTTEVES